MNCAYQRVLSLSLPFAIILGGCAAGGTSIITESEGIEVSRIKNSLDPVPLVAAIHITKDAFESSSIFNHHAKGEVWSYGAIGPKIVDAVRSYGPKTFSRAFLAPKFPNSALWSEGVEVVFSIESARASMKQVSFGSAQSQWEIVLVIGLYSIDGHPFGYHLTPQQVRRAFYKVAVTAPVDYSTMQVSNRTPDNYMRTSLEPLHQGIDAAVREALIRFPRSEAEAYIKEHHQDIDVHFGMFLANEGDPKYALTLRTSGQGLIEGLTPTTPAPTIGALDAFVMQERHNANLMAMAGALQGSQARMFGQMGMQSSAALSSMMSQVSLQQAQQYQNALTGAGGAVDPGSQALMMFIGGVTAYGSAQAQRRQQSLAGAGRPANPRCDDLIRMRNDAVRNRDSMASNASIPGTRASGQSTGQAGAQQDAAVAFQKIYDTYCR